MALRGVYALIVAVSLLAGPPAAAQEEKTWADIRFDIIGDRVPEDGGAVLSLVAPKRAEDAAIVPIDVHVALPPAGGRKLAKLTLVVDENPAPVVGTFGTGEPADRLDVSLRVRVNAYSYVRAIAETTDGAVYMAKAYVKAAGGCSAPASKDPAEALANLGQMRFRVFAERGEAQVQMRHPNFSGLQMDQVTRLYTPAWFVESLTVRQGDKPVFQMTGGISVSEDPTFRFGFQRTGEPITVEAKDTEGRVFRQTFPGADAS